MVYIIGEVWFSINCLFVCFFIGVQARDWDTSPPSKERGKKKGKKRKKKREEEKEEEKEEEETYFRKGKKKWMKEGRYYYGLIL